MSEATSADGTRIDYEQSGSGPTVILICAGPTDRNSNAEIAGLLANSCTVINYDRRGRGSSGDTPPYSVDREVEDLRAVAKAAGGEVGLFGNSGGAFLAFRAVAAGMPCTRIAVWEAPYIIEGSRPAVPADYAEQQADLAERGDPGAMVELFMTSAVGMPPEVVAGMRQAPFWGFLEAAASPALVYDAELAGDFAIDTGQLAEVTCPVLVLDGGTTPWLSQAAEAVAAAAPSAVRQTLTGQQHNVVSAFLYAWAQTHRPRFEAVRVVAERWSARSHELRDVLSRNNVTFGFHPPDSTEGRLLLRQFGLDETRLPVVITYTGDVLVQPTNSEVAGSLGIRTRPDPTVMHDILIVGAGPAGIAATVYAASEGLHVAGIEREAIGGQAASSSLIRDYPGFPRGISGTELTARAFQQAGSFGAEFVYGQARGLRAEGSCWVVDLGEVGEIRGRAVLLATGVNYRKLDVPSLERLVGRGVFYGAAAAEAPAMRDQEVYVVGGANSAGQAALHLARYAGRLTMLVRRPALKATMSDYLIQQIDATQNIVVRHEADPSQSTHRAAGGCPRRRAVRAHRCRTAHPGWSLERPPAVFETSLPGVFAIGDVRHGSVKRVASSVGEGSVAARLLHDYLGLDT